MKSMNRVCFTLKHSLFYLTFVLVLLAGFPPNALSFQFVDDAGETIVIHKPPTQVVSLVPSITEILHKIGAGPALKAVTYHDTYPAENATKVIAGGYFSPSLDVIEAVKPDLIFYSGLQKGVEERFGNSHFPLVELETRSMADSREKILLLGKIFNKEKQAQALVESMAESWGSPLVPRGQIEKFTSGLYQPAYLANLDCNGLGPKGAFKIGRQIVYPISDLISWLVARIEV